MGVVSLLEAVMGTSVDLHGLETGLEKGEKMAEEGANKIAGHFGAMAVTISAAIVGTVLTTLGEAIHKTAEWGLEISELSDRMGMTTRETAVLVGMMERFNVNAGLGARAMTILSQEVRITQQSLDPFATRLGRTLGTLRDTNKEVLNMGQVLDLIREKVRGASTDTEKLQVATQLLGGRIGGQLIGMLKLSSEEWEKQKKSVEGSIGSIEQAADAAVKFKKASEELSQSLRKSQIDVGTVFLPLLTKSITFWDEFSKNFTSGVQSKGGLHFISAAIEAASKALYTADQNAQAAASDTDRLAEASERVAEEIEATEQNERKVVALTRERLSLEERAMSLGLNSDVRGAAADALTRLEEQRMKLVKELSSGRLTDDQRLRIEEEIMKVKVEEAEVVRNSNETIYKREEQAIELAKKLRLQSIDTEIAYRKNKSAELLGRGDVFGAAEELIKARDLAEQQQDQIFEFTKKIRVVSLENEIEYQKMRLAQVKGSAEEEMKVLSKIADLDKNLYDQRLQFGLSYTKNITDQYNKVMEAAKKTGDVETYEGARIDAERNLRESTREAGQVLHGGGTTEQRETSQQWAQFVLKTVEQMQQLGERVSSDWKDASDMARDILRAASGGESVRAPGGPSPTVGSLLSPAEGLATEGLARGSDIPRLDTSFTDLAIRVRDVLLGTVPNVQNFSNAVADAAKKIAVITGTPLNPGIIGPGGGTTTLPTQGSGQLATSGQTIAPPTTGPGGTSTSVPSSQVGISSTGENGIAEATKALKDATDALKEAQRVTNSIQSEAAASQREALENLVSTIQSSHTTVHLTIDPNSGDILANALVNQLSQ